MVYLKSKKWWGEHFEMSKTTSCHLIAYFDILGYKNIVQNKSLIQGEEVNEGEIIAAIEDIVKSVSSITNDIFGARSAKTYCFSDNFVIAVKVKDGFHMLRHLEMLVFIIQLLQKKLILEFGFFIRGSIVKGNLYASKSFIYGDGLIKAYSIENELAYYPRIVLEYSLFKEVQNLVESCFLQDEIIVSPEEITEANFFYYARWWIFHNEDDESKRAHLYNYNYKSICFRKDFDNEYFVDFLSELYNQVDETGIMETVNLYPTDEELDNMTGFNLALWGYCKAVFSAMKNYSNSQDILVKYLWCCSYINLFCFENNIEQPFTAESIQYDTGINLKNIKYCDMLKHLIVN